MAHKHSRRELVTMITAIQIEIGRAQEAHHNDRDMFGHDKATAALERALKFCHFATATDEPVSNKEIERLINLKIV